MSADSMSPLAVLQSCRTWLPTTQHWLATQVFALPDTIRTAIACRDAQNLDRFHHARLHIRDEREYGPRPVSWAIDQLKRVGPAGTVVREWERRRWANFRVDLADSEGAEVLHSHFGNTGWLDRPVARRADLAHVVSFYGYDISYLPREQPEWEDRLQRVFDEVDRVLCEGPHFADQLEEAGCPPHKIEVHHLGVDLDAHPFEPRTREEDEPIRVLMAASFKQKKGLPDAITALGQLKADFDFEVTLIGDATDEERSRRERERIDDKIRHYALEDRIRRPGFVSYERLVDEMLDHDIFLSPSVLSERGDSEGGAPVSIVAAQATGMPFVGTTHADLPHVVEHGESGLLAEEHDVPGLVNHLRRLFEHPEDWAEMGERARERVEAEFNADVQAERLAGIYHRVASGSP